MIDDIKVRLIETAGEAFGQRGFDAVGVREICQRAGANVAAVNYHFGDKQGLYVACLRHAQSRRVEELSPPNWPPEFTPQQKLQAFIHEMLKSKLDASRPRWHLEMMLHEMARPTDACREIVEDYIRPMANTLAGILQELNPGSPWNRQSWLIGFSVVSQVLFYHVHQPVIRILMGPDGFESLTLDLLTDHITRFCLAALGHGEPVSIQDAAEGTPS